MNTTVKERLKAFIAAKKMSTRKFEGSINVANGYIGNISKGIGADVLMRLLDTYPEINAEWLLYGEGDMFKDVDTSLLQTGDVSGQNVINNSSTGNVKQIASGNETKLLQEISNLKDKLMKMQQMVIRACMATTPEEKNEILKEVMSL